MGRNIRTLVFFDVETSGLDKVRDRITEVSMQAILMGDFLKFEPHTAYTKRNQSEEGRKLPRILFKTRFCVNPAKTIHLEASKVSGLYNDMLNDLPVFGESHFTAIQCVFHQTVGPWCLIAHNGIKFDFPILKAQLERVQQVLPHDVFCLDSLQAIKGIDTKWTSPPSETDPPLPSSVNPILESPSGSSSPYRMSQKSDKTFLYSPTAKRMIPQMANVSFITPPGLVTPPASKNGSAADTSPVHNHHDRCSSPPAKVNLFDARKEDSAGPSGGAAVNVDQPETTVPSAPAYQRIMATASGQQHSYSLKATYLRLFPNASGAELQFHTAEDDVEALLRVCREYGEEFVQMVEEKSVPFATVSYSFFSPVHDNCSVKLSNFVSTSE